jgi:CHAT domain-containing protein
MLFRRVGYFFLTAALLQPVSACAETNAVDLLRRADQFADLFNWSDAGPLYHQAAQLFDREGDLPNAKHAKLGEIRASMETLDLPETSDFLGRELDSALLQSDLQLRLMCLIVKGDIDGEIDSGPAFADWTEALKTAQTLSDNRWESRARAELGFQQFLRGDSAAAMKAVAGALIYAHRTGDVGAQIRYLGAIGTGLALRQSSDQAIQYLDQAIGLAKKTPNAGYPFVAVAGKIQALINKREFGPALSLINEAKHEAETRRKNIKLAQLFLFEADIAMEQHHWPEAVRSLIRAAGLPGPRQSRLFSECEMKLADVYRQQHDFRRAEAAAAAAVAATGGSSDIYLAPARLRTLAAVESALGRKAKANELLQRATDIVEGFVARAPDLPVRSAILTEASAIFADHFTLATDQGHPEEAFRIIEEVRGRIVAERMLHPVVADVTDIKTEDEVRRLKVSLVKARTQRERRVLSDRLFFAEQARWTKLSETKQLPSINPSSEISLGLVQRELGRNETVLEFVLGTDESFCLKINRSEAKIVRVAPKATIEAAATAYLSQVKARQDCGKAARQLYALLIEPLGLTQSVSSIILVPDGVLNLIPFAALVDQTGELLVRKRTVWLLPSAGTLVLQRRTHKAEAPRMLLAVGGVEYGENTTGPAATRRTDYDIDPSRIPDLPGTEEEVRSAAQTLRANDAVLQIGKDGTETQFKNAPLDQFRIIHLAVHGKANDKNVERAALLFRPNPPTDDGLLESREILGLRLNADLVVLSACETAVGHMQGEEGIANLARIFLMVGAKSVVSTLWQIDDNYSLFLMKRFYTHVRDGKTVAEALSLSQNELLEKFGPDTPPADWAAFTVIGEGNTLIPSTKLKEISQR